MKNLVSVIVPTHGNKDLTDLIRSVKTSLYPHIELIIVNENAERSYQRNLGIQRSNGEFLLFMDDDWRLRPWLIASCVSMMYKFDAIYIPEVIKTKGLFAYIRNWERQFYVATPIDCVRFVRREGCPRFDESMSGPEDSDWDRRVIGRRGVSLVPYYHYDNVSMIKWFCKKAYYAKSMSKYAQKNKNDKVLDWKWRCFGVFIENGKWRVFLSRPDLALAVLTMIFIRGIIYAKAKT